MIRFEALLEKVEQYQSNTELLRRAYVFSAVAHKGQVRKSGEPYLSHPLEVANILADMKLDLVCVTVGLLHDVVEDTLAKLDMIREQFGEDIAHIVDGVTKIGQIQFASRHEKQAENFRKMLLAMVDDIRVILVKLADRLHNMRTLEYLPPEKRERIAKETLEIYAPLAHRLGMSKIRSELEDLSFSHIDPQAYQQLVAQTQKKRAVSEEFIAEVMKTLEKKLKEHSITASIEHRIKRIYSTHQKMRRQSISIDEVYDFIAIRIITDSVKDCYAALGVVHNTWKPVPGRIKDYIAMPRQNLYQALHTSVIGKNGQPFEVQIRTKEMHHLAEEGIAAHWKYKEQRLGAGKDDGNFAWLRHLLEWQKDVKDPHQFLSNLKIDLYPEEVYSFTPNGDVITLPRNATPIDFAYSIHTEVGHTCVGAKVNGRLVPLKYKLRNGEIVEILTSKGHEPGRDWLQFVKTSKARNRIRQYLNVKQREESIGLGKKILDKEIRRLHLKVKKYLQGESLERALKGLRLQKLEDAYSEIGYGKLSGREFLDRVLPDGVQGPIVEEKESKIATAVKKVFGKSDSPIMVKGHSDLLVYRAQCCEPLKGEEIIGYITRGKGVSVHSVNCQNVEGLLHNPERRIGVEWTDTAVGDLYSVKISILTEDRPGMLAGITAAIATANTNIRNANVTTENGRGVLEITVEIPNVKHLQRIMQLVKEVEGVIGVDRTGKAAKQG
ncbi:MAG: bifunctional (p)ppGpp synthetase/guanosine-3',5'-bis(diphosphate) 3'-pyrophosphohydrolase [Acidobacteria bacterium]|nr:bifunctional (p)ppGpp synthetase/guanosine-3',5'-bis(diphosphate) 3'-pyrophosphohydrolase [Acidobacteriota bacterium]MBI3657509.1 bifunctional (p)ppGpp synthetase/guanosine-3',5'-bis(diphosphate) 3'-pyrophosphohydrolase [Acidobacteriota bacterium]